MGNDRVVEVPYAGVLKKIFELERNENIKGDFNVGKKYRLKSSLIPPRQWSVTLQKLPTDSTYVLRPCAKTIQPPNTEPQLNVLASLVVTEIKFCKPHIIMWVKNASGSVANLTV